MELPIVVYSHLPWDSVFQRPHHLISRLALERKVVFVEEPVPCDATVPSWELQWLEGELVVARAYLPLERPGFPPVDPRLEHLTQALLSSLAIDHHVAWLYTPMATGLARALNPVRIAYDCMDDHSCLLGAPPEMELREAQLLRAADVVFTDGESLYRAKRSLHPNVHCVPSSVDAAHFRPALASPPEAEGVEGLPRPRLGFCGVLDERLDTDLLEGLADARPGWQIVLVGPVARIEPADLPRRPNLHYLGPRPYQELPAHLAHWDVCLLPFARSSATRLIRPAQTLEYMAAEKAIVSTPIRDVAEPYGDVVELAEDVPTFVAACERVLSEDAEARARRVAGMRRVVAHTSWEATVHAMATALFARRPAFRARPRSALAVDPARAREDGTR